MWRRKKLEKWTGPLERRAADDIELLQRERGLSVTSKHVENFHLYALHRLRHFADRQAVYSQPKVSRLKFDAYTNQQRHYDRTVKEYFPDADKTIVYGAGCGFMNTARINGVRKYSHDRLLRALRNHGRKVIIVDESYTTKRCSNCVEVNGVSSGVIVSKSPHRYVYCPICRKGTHRDKNGAKNIFLKALMKNKEQNFSPPSVVGVAMFQ